MNEWRLFEGWGIEHSLFMTEVSFSIIISSATRDAIDDDPLQEWDISLCHSYQESFTGTGDAAKAYAMGLAVEYSKTQTKKWQHRTVALEALITEGG